MTFPWCGKYCSVQNVTFEKKPEYINLEGEAKRKKMGNKVCHLLPSLILGNNVSNWKPLMSTTMWVAQASAQLQMHPRS